MSRIFWDTMLFSYLLEEHKQFAVIVENLLDTSYKRKDQLLTSYLTMGELLAGGKLSREHSQEVIDTVQRLGFQLIDFDRDCVEPFRLLRSRFRLRSADAVHLACAAAARTDMFLTGDEELIRKNLHLPGINFVAHFENAPL